MYNPNIQIDLYTLAINKLFKTNCAGIIIDGIQVAKTKNDLLRDNISKTRQDMIIFEKNLEKMTKDIQLSIDNNNWYTCGCGLYKNSCSFKEVCVNYNREVQLEILTTDFKIEEWNPLEGLEDGEILTYES